LARWSQTHKGSAMAASFRDGAVVGLCLMAMLVVGSIGAEAQLTLDFYDDSCPQIYDIVLTEVQAAVAAEARMAASLVRLHFHDCFVNGCDGSVLLNSTDDLVSEQTVVANADSVRGFFVIDTIKAKLEAACPQTVSCADIVAIASRDSAVLAGLTPGYPVFFGRRDSLTFNISAADAFLPSPFSNYSILKANFEAVGLGEVDLVALSGAHTVGRVNCTIVRRTLTLNNTLSLFNPSFLASNAKQCGPPTVNKLLNLDLTTPDTFDNWYYKNLLVGEGILISDMVLWKTPGIINQPLVLDYAINPLSWAVQFGISTIRMGNIKPLTGDEGEIRLNCAVINNQTSSSGSGEPRVASQ